MEDLTKENLKLFFKEDIYLIKEKNASTKLSETAISKPDEANNQSTTTSVVEKPAPIAAPKLLAYKGGNTKGIALIITDDANEFLNTTDESLLLNILKAIGFSIQDVAIINQHTAGNNWVTQIDFSNVIVFGILPSTYGFTSSNYTIEEKEEAKWLFSDSLFSLASNKELKGKLWIKLQELF
ncbi:MAG: hypothetical protein L3J06_00405 [Cyclobacteriaceae bacterium]|nr:hypothetical protein [Cyclobacteriaceae bacterium]